jgi:hypothetical protein
MSTSHFQATNVNPQGLSALIRNLGRDCPPTQYLREFLKNAIEACQRTTESDNQITIDLNPEVLETQNLYKIAFTDNGDGMTGEQMLTLLNSLSASGAVANEHQNYGVGAKISAMTRNHAGILYESWKGGVGHAILIRYEPENDLFGIQGVEEDGKTNYLLKLDGSYKPNFIKAHGTRVTLFGMEHTQDTMLPPEGVWFGRDDWIEHILNMRFFKLPNNIQIETRYGYHHDVRDFHRNYLKPLTGYQPFLNSMSLNKGSLRLGNANYYWWILKESVPVHGHAALINQGEIFERKEHWENTLALFGILVGRNRLVIYVEPDDVEQNTPRTNLLHHDGSPVVWQGWQEAFRANMPQEIKDFLDTLLNSAAQRSHTQNIRKRLKALMQLFILSGYKPIPTESYKASDDPNDPKHMVVVVGDEDPGKSADNPPDSEHHPVDGQSHLPEENAKPEGGSDTDLQAALPDEPELKLFPQVKWTNEERSPSLVGMAAEYLQESHVILANRDFKGFKDLITYFMDQYANNEEITEQVISSVNEGVEQALMESVAGILSLEGSHERWDNPHHRNAALSMEALTTTVMQRYWMVSYINQKLKEKISTSLQG